MNSLFNHCLLFAKTAATKATAHTPFAKSNSRMMRKILFSAGIATSAAAICWNREACLSASNRQMSRLPTPQQGEVTPSFAPSYPEYQKLITKIQNLAQLQPYTEEGEFSRGIVIGYDENGKNPVFIKAATPAVGHTENQPQAKHEQLAFIISERFDLKVVPPTIALENYQEQEIDHMLPNIVLEKTKSDTHSYNGVVIQEGVSNCSKQPGRVDRTQVQKAILLNVLLGRGDAGIQNTVITNTGECMEVDNEYLGSEETNSWLCTHYEDQIFDGEIIRQFLSHPTAILEDIFRSHRVEPKIEKRIRTNLNSMRQFFSLQQEKTRVRDLLKFMQTQSQ